MSPSRLIAVAAHPSVLGPVAFTIAFASRHKPGVAPRLTIALPLSVAMSKVAKRLYPRQKPRLLTLTPRESFPSGHGTAAAALAFSLVDAFSAWRALPIAIAAVALVDIARVHDDEHRVSEVLVGNAIGLTGAVIASIIARRMSRRARDGAANQSA